MGLVYLWDTDLGIFTVSHDLTLMWGALFLQPWCGEHCFCTLLYPFPISLISSVAIKSDTGSTERPHRNTCNYLTKIYRERQIQNMNCNLGVFRKKIKDFTAETLIKGLDWILGTCKFSYSYHEHRNKTQIRLKRVICTFISEILYFQVECKKINTHSKILVEVWAQNKCLKTRFCLRKTPCDLFLRCYQFTQVERLWTNAAYAQMCTSLPMGYALCPLLLLRAGEIN